MDSNSAKARKKKDGTKKTVQDRPPNFRGKDGRLFLVRCFACDPVRGKINYSPNVAAGICTWCGWKENQ